MPTALSNSELVTGYALALGLDPTQNWSVGNVRFGQLTLRNLTTLAG